MKFNIGDHLQEIDSQNHGIVIKFLSDFDDSKIMPLSRRTSLWYLLENSELDLINHWVPESKLELHKQPLRDKKLKELGI